MNVTTTTRQAEIEHARTVDTEVARLFGVFYDLQRDFATQEGLFDSATKYAADYRSNGDFYIAAAERQEAKAAAAKAEMTRIAALADTARREAIAFDEANYEGWQRFFLVEHIHATRHCHSFRPTTRIGWLPEISGHTEAEAVAAHGAILCTICFPTAPVEYTKGPEADPATCAGSGQYHSTEHLTGRERSYSSPSGYCPVCLRWNTVTKTGVMRKHKVDITRRHATESMKVA